jgi:hypothetical protein
MKVLSILLFFSLCFSTAVHGATVTCYSNGRQVFRDSSPNVIINPDFIIVSHKHYDHAIIRENHYHPLCFMKKLST